MLAEAHNYESSLNGHFVDGFPDKCRHEKHSEWNLQMPTRQTSQVKQWIGDLHRKLTQKKMRGGVTYRSRNNHRDEGITLHELEKPKF